MFFKELSVHLQRLALHLLCDLIILGRVEVVSFHWEEGRNLLAIHLLAHALALHGWLGWLGWLGCSGWSLGFGLEETPYVV